MLFKRGNAISGAPNIKGTNQFPKPPIKIGITIKKIIINACAVTIELYNWWFPKNTWFPGYANSKRIKTDKKLFQQAIYIDRRNGIWYKDYKNEALRYLRYTPSPFQTFDFAEGNPNKNFRGGRGIAKLNDSLLFVGSILDYKKQKLSPSIHLHDLRGGVFGVSITKKNEFWIGIESGRAVLIDSTGKQLLATTSLNNYEITWIVQEDQAQKVWSGTNKGLAYLDRKRNLFIPATQYNAFPHLEQSAIFYIYEKGNFLYLCTSSGLYLWDKEKGEMVSHLPFENSEFKKSAGSMRRRRI